MSKADHLDQMNAVREPGIENGAYANLAVVANSVEEVVIDSEEDRQTHWNRMMAELMGKETGYCKGRGGSMHIADVDRCNNLGSTGIVGGNQAPAVGAALAEKYKKTGKVVLSFFGDGSTNTGSFHESMNISTSLLPT